MQRTLDQRGNAYIEYFVLATIVALATLAFFFNGVDANGNFVPSRFNVALWNVQSAFSESVNAILAP